MYQIKFDYQKLEKYKYNKSINWDDWSSKKNCYKKYEHVISLLIYGKHLECKTKYSIVIPTYKRADLLKQALDSAINQKNYHKEYEIIVLDNNELIDEATDLLMKQYCLEHNNIIYYRNECNIGMFGNWNRCIEVCKSEWLCMLHDDDLLCSNYLETMDSFSLKDSVGIVFNEQHIMDETGMKKGIARRTIGQINTMLNKLKGLGRAKVKPWHYPQAASSCATLYNKKLCLDIGGFDDSFDPLCDWIMWAKMTIYYDVVRTGKILSHYRFLCNVFFKPETQRYVLLYTYLFNYLYSVKMKRNFKLCMEQVVRTYKDMCTCNPERINFYNDILVELKLDKKYYNGFLQNFIYTKYLVKLGIEKLLIL